MGRRGEPSPALVPQGAASRASGRPQEGQGCRSVLQSVMRDPVGCGGGQWRAGGRCSWRPAAALIHPQESPGRESCEHGLQVGQAHLCPLSLCGVHPRPGRSHLGYLLSEMGCNRAPSWTPQIPACLTLCRAVLSPRPSLSSGRLPNRCGCGHPERQSNGLRSHSY